MSKKRHEPGHIPFAGMPEIERMDEGEPTTALGALLGFGAAIALSAIGILVVAAITFALALGIGIGLDLAAEIR